MKQKYLRKINKNEAQLSAMNRIQQQQSQAQLNEKIHQRFQNFLSNQKLKKLKYAMQNCIGRNTPINYHKQYGFHQQWQSKRKSYQMDFSDFTHSHNLCIQILALVVLAGYCLLVWFISFQSVFQHFKNQFSVYFYTLGLLTVILHFVLKTILNSKHLKNQPSYLFYIRNYIMDFILLVYFIINLSIMDRIQQAQSVQMTIFHVFFVLNGYKRGAEIYKSFKMKVITSIYKDFFNLFDLLATSVNVAHLFALILFLAAGSNHQNQSWTIVAGIDCKDPTTQYIYSLYFACTTMLTIGYGDITPRNVVQIVAVLFIQIFGVASFAYVINEIGHTLSSMRKNQESLEKDLSSLSKVAKYYGLDQELEIKARAYIIDNQTSFNELLPQEEKQLLMKLNDELRTDINQENSLKIIKSSVFFICHWSKKMQFQVAKKLTKKLYSPNQKLFQYPGKESIYVIKRGKVDIYTDQHSGLKRHFKKLLKSIQSKEDQNVSDNIYGYTAVMSRRPIKLNAITKDFTVVYYIQKNDFFESVMEHELDFQYYHQIKIKIDLEKLPQAYEAPSILNIREHYRPNVCFVIKKQKKKFHKNKRMDYIRGQMSPHKRRSKVHIYDCIEQLEGDLQYRNVQRAESYRQQYMLRSKQMTDNAVFYFSQINQTKKNLHTCFDASKQYENYFKKFNISNVLLTSEIQNFFQSSTKNNVQTTTKNYLN